jgi:hypothetical protein
MDGEAANSMGRTRLSALMVSRKLNAALRFSAWVARTCVAVRAGGRRVVH